MAEPTVEVVDMNQLKEGKNISTDIGLILEVILKVRVYEQCRHFSSFFRSIGENLFLSF